MSLDMKVINKIDKIISNAKFKKCRQKYLKFIFQVIIILCTEVVKLCKNVSNIHLLLKKLIYGMDMIINI